MVTEGQKLYEIVYNGEIKEVTVKEVKRKYFTIDEYRSYKFRIDILKYEDENYSQRNRQLYLSIQEIEDEREHQTLSSIIRKRFSSYGKLSLTLDQLRRINSILTLNPAANEKA